MIANHELRAGLERFAEAWNQKNGALVSKRLEAAMGRSLLCESHAGERVVLQMTRAHASLTDEPSASAPHAVVRMANEDWQRVLSGQSHIMAIVLAGRAPFPKDQRRLIIQFSMLLQTTLLSIETRAAQPAHRSSGVPSASRGTKVTQAYAEFAQDLRFEDLPDDVVNLAREQLVATMGSCYTGSQMPAAAALREGAAIFGSGRECSLFGSAARLSAPAAALYNSGVAQVLDFDDWVIISHTGAAVVPTAMAVGELTGASGREILTAIVLGNEINARTSRAIQKGGYIGNSMPNHQIETALIASRLLGLNVLQTQRAVSHSCFLAMESCHTGWMTDSKVLCNGLPAMWGIASASLAKAGLVGNVDMIEHTAGYLSTVSEIVDLEELLKDLGSDWYTRTLNTKRHPSCAYNLPAIECALAIRAHIPDFEVSKVESIEVDGPGVMLYVAARFQSLSPDVYEQIRDRTATHVALCFDAGHGVLASLVDGEFGHRQYLDERALSPELQALRPKISFRTDARMHAAYYSDYRYGARVRVRMKDGREFVEQRDQFLGASNRPFDHADKFLEGARLFMSEERAQTALATLRRFESVDDLRSVSSCFQPEPIHQEELSA